MAPLNGEAERQRYIGTAYGNYNTINLTYNTHAGEKTIDLLAMLHPIEENRMQAEDWKSLHEDFQRISLKLVFVRGAVAGEDLKLALQGLQDHWSFDCRDLIQYFVNLERLPERMVRREFITESAKSKWLVNIASYALALDGIIDECKEAEDLRGRFGEILATLRRLELISGQLLSFLDFRLQKVIKELDLAIAQARRSLTEPLNSTPPKETS